MKNTGRRESFADEMLRLFPPQEISPLHINGTHAYDITFQVTEDCCMKCSYCLIAGTKITMQDYSIKNIENIIKGDKIIGVNAKENKLLNTTTEIVKEIYTHYDNTIIISTENGEKIECTEEHPFWTDNGWIEAKKLKEGIELYYFNSLYLLKKTKIISITEGQKQVLVYNFATTNHTYIANGFLVHNCYQQNKSRNHMSFETAKKFIDMVLASDERTNSYITSTKTNGVALEFIGGEPLLEIDLIDQIVDYFKEQCFLLHHPWATRYIIGICSNGLLYFDPRVQKFLKKHQGHMSFSVSIDGNKELHDACRVDLEGKGTYDRAIAAAMDYSNNYDSNLGSKMTLAPGNINYVYQAVVDLIAHGYKTINLNCVYEEGWEVSHAKILYEQLKLITDYLFDNNLINEIYLSIFGEFVGKTLSNSELQNYCGGTGLMLALDWRGFIYPCLRYMPSSLNGKQEPYIIGDIETGINTLPEYKKKVNCLQCITRRTQSDDECFYCSINGGCGGCSGYNYECFGTPDKKAKYICIMHQARVLGNAYYFKKKNEYNKQRNSYILKIPEDWALKIINEEEYKKLL